MQVIQKIGRIHLCKIKKANTTKCEVDRSLVLSTGTGLLLYLLNWKTRLFASWIKSFLKLFSCSTLKFQSTLTFDSIAFSWTVAWVYFGLLDSLSFCQPNMFTTSVTALETWKMWLMCDHGHDFNTASNVHLGRKVFNTDKSYCYCS